MLLEQNGMDEDQGSEREPMNNPVTALQKRLMVRRMSAVCVCTHTHTIIYVSLTFMYSMRKGFG